MNGDARKVGLKELDIIVEVDGRIDIGNFSELLAYLVQEKKSGDQLNLTVLRKDRQLDVELPLNWEKRIQALRSP
jgi:S1-C subfamily serine protease